MLLWVHMGLYVYRLLICFFIWQPFQVAITYKLKLDDECVAVAHLGNQCFIDVSELASSFPHLQTFSKIPSFAHISFLSHLQSLPTLSRVVLLIFVLVLAHLKLPMIISRPLRLDPFRTKMAGHHRRTSFLSLIGWKWWINKDSSSLIWNLINLSLSALSKTFSENVVNTEFSTSSRNYFWHDLSHRSPLKHEKILVQVILYLDKPLKLRGWWSERTQRQRKDLRLVFTKLRKQNTSEETRVETRGNRLGDIWKMFTYSAYNSIQFLRVHIRTCTLQSLRFIRTAIL